MRPEIAMALRGGLALAVDRVGHDAQLRPTIRGRVLGPDSNNRVDLAPGFSDASTGSGAASRKIADEIQKQAKLPPWHDPNQTIALEHGFDPPRKHQRIFTGYLGVRAQLGDSNAYRPRQGWEALAAQRVGEPVERISGRGRERIVLRARERWRPQSQQSQQARRPAPR
jgi:hypothetical protein